MKRTLPLAILAGAQIGGSAGEMQRAEPRDGIALRARDLIAMRDGTPARLCPGARNAARLVVSITGERPHRAVPVQLFLVLATGGAATLVAEGSITFDATVRQATFTFLNVEVPARLRGRGARLVARVNADRTVPEQELGDNSVTIELDAATDWGCAG